MNETLQTILFCLLIYLSAAEIAALVIKGLIIGPNIKPWKGGNDCNLVRIFGLKSPCCIEHDHAYKEGGWMIARLKADLALAGCIFQSGLFGIFFAPIVLVGVRLGGMWFFQWGKKRTVPYPKTP